MRNRKLTIVLIVILSLFAFSLIGGLVFSLATGHNFNFSFDFINPKMSLTDSYETYVNDINKVYLNLHSTDIEIKESTNEKLLVEYYSNRDNNAEIEYSDNLVKVDEDNYNVSCFGFCNSRRKVVVYVPTTYLGKFDLNTKSGDVNIDVDLSNNKVNVYVMSGDISLNIVGAVNASTISGDIRIDKITESAVLKTTSGDVFVKTLDIKENSKIGTISGDVNVNNNQSNCYVESSAVSGDVRISNSDRKSDIVLTINVISGDINVD